METTSTSKPKRKANASVDMEPATKPKKVYSETRKKQNRIASRNYREKRKQKLQYLQQLLEDGPRARQNLSISSESNDEERSRSLSVECLASSAAGTPTSLPDGSDYDYHDTININPTIPTSNHSYSNHLSETQSYQYSESSWYEPSYDTEVHFNPAWTSPHWAPNTTYTVPLEPTMVTQEYQYPMGQLVHGYGSSSIPSLQHQGTTLDTNVHFKSYYTHGDRISGQSLSAQDYGQDYVSTNSVFI
ncbi:hypothetical protein BU24DRAFT_7094 [Aaosphaeria arxii CBS 175.79]|uniref:BZIP domain-containing protein n=1 Tax=Aaosphaeria arxii CBS 175.79 TaxID=1450172 RepID=A0A6A5Y5Z4_9PLEO|nr:uncharacterized protein BU24DRAFT_7094 [Aaosphaeria arxii CBS 175.79]KAF2020706.1 hypothetical protein BU24DRAFT_7094 [Aaosphaeria arxii CBS 175.79]